MDSKKSNAAGSSSTSSSDRYRPPMARGSGSNSYSRPLFNASGSSSRDTSLSLSSIAFRERLSRANKLPMNENERKSVLTSNNLMIPDLDELRGMTLDEGRSVLERFLRAGYLLPRAELNLILKKFQIARHKGDWDKDEDAKSLYEAILEKYKDGSAEDDIRDTHTEMMLVYIRRNKGKRGISRADFEKIEPTVSKIFRDYPHTFTFNLMLMLYLDSNKLEKFKGFYDAHPQYHEDQWSYVNYLNYYWHCKDHTAVIEMFRDIVRRISVNQHDERLRAQCINAVYKFMISKAKSVEEAENFFKEIVEGYIAFPEPQSKDDIKHSQFFEESARALLKVYTREKEIDKAIEFFNSWTFSPRDPSYTAIISALVDTHSQAGINCYLQAMAYYKKATEEDDCYEYFCLRPKIERDKKFLVLDLHNRYVKEGGTPIYGPPHAEMVNIILLSLYEELAELFESLPQMKSCYIQVITGKGASYGLLKETERFLKENFSWDAKQEYEGAGSLVINLERRQLQSKITDVVSNVIDFIEAKRQSKKDSAEAHDEYSDQAVARP